MNKPESGSALATGPGALIKYVAIIIAVLAVFPLIRIVKRKFFIHDKQ
ncbi:MAG: hypothetical protein V1867_02500 [Candidatus Falkowbacteria bacterium]